MPAAAAIDSLERAIHLIRGHKVMLDSDLAAVYGVTTKRLLEQFKRNAKRFPSDFAFQVDNEEFAHLRSQIATSSGGHGGRRHLPWAFTEHGALMLASVRVVRAFIRLRELMLANKELATKFGELERRMDQQDTSIARLFDAIRQLIQPSLPQTKPEIGFHVRESEPVYGVNRKKS